MFVYSRFKVAPTRFWALSCRSFCSFDVAKVYINIIFCKNFVILFALTADILIYVK